MFALLLLPAILVVSPVPVRPGTDIEAEAGYPDYIEEVRDAGGAPDVFSIRFRDIEKWSTDGSYQPVRANYVRVKWERSKEWTAGVMTERDPGEVRLADNWKWALSYRRGSGRLKSLSVGYLRYEQRRGLLFFTRSRVSKGSQVLDATGRLGRGVGPDLSSTEGYTLRGVGLEIGLARMLTLTTVVSSSRLDAARDDSGNVTSVRTSGFHPVSSSTDRDGLSISTLIGHLDVSLGRRGVAGITLAGLSYSEPIRPPLEVETVHDFRGRERCFTGFDWDLNVSKIGIFGETGWEHGRGAGVITGLAGGAGPSRWNIVFRDYDPDFSPPYGNPFQDGRGFPTNEKGFYSGLEWTATPDIRLALYVDTYRRSWRQGRDPFPESEREMFIESRWRGGKRFWATVRFLERHGERTETVDSLLKNRDFVTRKVRLQIDWEDKPMTFRGRYEGTISSMSGTPGETGSLLYFDTRYRPGSRITLDLRVTLFASGSPSTTIYAYEKDLPGIMNVAACSGDGMKWYLYGRYRIRKGMTISVKFDENHRLIFEDEGLLAVRINRRLGVQFDYRD